MIETVRAVGWGAMDILQSYYTGENQANLEVNEDKKVAPLQRQIRRPIITSLKKCRPPLVTINLVT